MIKYGFNARYKHDLQNEIALAKENGFDFLQLYYRGDCQELDRLSADEGKIKEGNFPVIIHAVIDIAEFETAIPRISQILKNLNLSELIIHPVNSKKLVSTELIPKIEKTLASLSEITVFLENNSRLDPVFQTQTEIKMMFENNPRLELLLDLAHIDDYDHLGQIITIKAPKILHISDRHLEVIHEHLPIGMGNIDFKKIFKEFLPSFDGRVIFEISSGFDDILESRTKIMGFING